MSEGLKRIFKSIKTQNGKRKTVDSMIEEGIFQIKEDGEIYFSDAFVNIIEKVREVGMTFPDWLTDSFKGERNLKKAIKKGVTAAYLWAYLCFKFNKEPKEAEGFEMLYKGEEKEIQERLEMIMAFHEATKDQTKERGYKNNA